MLTFANLASFTQGSDVVLLRDGSYASSKILDLDLLEGIAYGGSPQSTTQMDVKGNLLPPQLKQLKPL